MSSTFVSSHPMGIWVRRRPYRGPTAWISAYQGRSIAASESPPCQQQSPTLSTWHSLLLKEVNWLLDRKFTILGSFHLEGFIHYFFPAGKIHILDMNLLFLRREPHSYSIIILAFMECLMHRRGILHNRAFDRSKGTLQ